MPKKKNTHTNTSTCKPIPVATFSEQSYLAYAMNVILNRALPHITDGLKPVQRRIIYAMRELGLTNGAKHKKSARTVGDVLGKYHPHGDSACYEAMVLMAQSFSFRYPYLDGQGNWGSVDDPSSFAAMRYTEARLAEVADVLLDELDQGTTEFSYNFDGTTQEPVTLPARLPMALVNGASGIAVGMATDIPPHNLTEIANACIAFVKNTRLPFEELLKLIPAPDFPSGCEIISSNDEIAQIYQTGNGVLRVRARYKKEQKNIVITHLPHQVSSARLIHDLSTLITTKKLPMLADVRDESDRDEPVRIVLVPQTRSITIDSLMSHLFATTNLEKTVRVNLNMISVSGAPRVFDLKSLIREWTRYRSDTVRKRLTSRLTLLKHQLAITEGLLTVFSSIDIVITIIRTSDDPKSALMKKFKITSDQATAILELRLRQLAKLEELKLKERKRALADESKKISQVLRSDTRFKTLLTKEISHDRDRFGDARRCPITQRPAAVALASETLIARKEITILVSRGGWVRAATGADFDYQNLSYKPGDSFLAAANAKTNLQTVFLDTSGRAYTTTSHDLPSSRGLGDPLSSRVNLKTGSTLSGAVNASDDGLISLASSIGYGFATPFENLKTKNKSGKAIVNPGTGSAINPISLTKTHVLFFTSDSKILIVKKSSLPSAIRGKGERVIILKKSKKTPVRLLFQAAIDISDSLTLVSSKNSTLTLSPRQLRNYHGKIRTSGTSLPKLFTYFSHGIIRKIM